MAKDFLGQELNVGDKVVFLYRNGGCGRILDKSVIRKILPKDNFGREFVQIYGDKYESKKTVVKVDWEEGVA